MNINPFLSIVIPVYNAEKYLPICINSILLQSFSDFELIIVNDGSTDNSKEICNQFASKDKRIKIIHSENKGASFARNLGLNNATGTWVTFVDSDDWLDSNFFLELIQHSNNTDLICGGFIINNNYKEKYTSTKDFMNLPPIQAVEKLYNIYYGMIYNIWGKLFLMDYIKSYNLSFEIGQEAREDGIFLFDYLLKIKKVTIISSLSLYHYRTEENSISLSKKKWNGNKLLMIYDSFYERMNILNNQTNTNNKNYLKIIQSDMSMTYMHFFDKIFYNPQDLSQYLNDFQSKLRNFNIVKKYRSLKSIVFGILFNLKCNKLLLFILKKRHKRICQNTPDRGI